jgi:hypothetical protein
MLAEACQGTSGGRHVGRTPDLSRARLDIVEVRPPRRQEVRLVELGEHVGFRVRLVDHVPRDRLLELPRSLEAHVHAMLDAL